MVDLKIEGDVLRFEIPALDTQMRFDHYLSKYAEGLLEHDRLKGLSRTQFQRLIREGRILLEGETVKPAAPVYGGEEIEISVPEPAPSDLVPEVMPLDVLFEDEHLIVINKRPGLVVHPGAGHSTGTLVHGLLAHCENLSGIGGKRRPGIVHRLDKDTSGIMVVAKDDQSHSALAEQFAERQVEKHYVTVVVGIPDPASGTIATFYGRHPTHRTKYTSRVSSGRRAVTNYATRFSAKGLSVVDIELQTGRTHQIRVHCADKRHPVLGDMLYGERAIAKLVDADARSFCEGVTRQALHAHRLAFKHPIKGKRLALEAPLFDDMSNIINYLED
jgi:23S rRNA pseudouridine1911/1915/1917 synthase